MFSMGRPLGFVDMRQGRPVVHTYGGPYERGAQHGRLLSEQVRACFGEVWREGWFRGSPLLPAPVWYAWARLNALFLDEDERAELRGMADGSGLSYADVLVMNTAPPVDAVHNFLSAGSVATAACTQIVAQGAATGDGRRLLGRNLDTVGLHRLHRHAVLQVHHPDTGYAWLTPGFAGKVLDAVTGWNERGLVVSQDVAELAFENCFGLYSGALIRRIVSRCATRAEALGLVQSLPRLGGGGKTITVTDRDGVMVIEVAQTLWGGITGRKRVATRGPGESGDAGDTIVVNNHFRAPEQVRHARRPSRSSAARHRRASALVRDLWGRVGLEALKAFMTDKTDGESGAECGPERPSDRIINWYGPRVRALGPFAVPAELEVRVATTISTVCDVTSGVMWVADGKPYVDSPGDYRPVDVHAELGRVSGSS